MDSDSPGSKVLPVADLREFFRDALQGALGHQHLRVEDQTEHYVVNMLTLFARTESLHEGAPGRAVHPPLARLLGEAHEAPTRAERERALQRVGDVSLFIAGFFAGSFARKLVDVDYHIAMGGGAYGTLAGSLGRGPRRVLAQVFGELADKFQPLVDALNEISEAAQPKSAADRLRLYEIWLKTGSPRAHSLLQGLGVTPTSSPGLRREH
jgi:hypothetical protein